MIRYLEKDGPVSIVRDLEPQTPLWQKAFITVLFVVGPLGNSTVQNILLLGTKPTMWQEYIMSLVLWLTLCCGGYFSYRLGRSEESWLVGIMSGFVLLPTSFFIGLLLTVVTGTFLGI